MRPESREGAGFVLAHEAAISGHIGGEDGREPALDPLSAQMIPPRRRPARSSIRPTIQDPAVCAPGGSRSTTHGLARRLVRRRDPVLDEDEGLVFAVFSRSKTQAIFVGQPAYLIVDPRFSSRFGSRLSIEERYEFQFFTD